MIVERVISCTNRACKRLILCSPGDPAGQCAVCATAALAAMRTSWLQVMGERDDARSELDAMTGERDGLVLELDRARELTDEDLDRYRDAIASSAGRVGRVQL